MCGAHRGGIAGAQHHVRERRGGTQPAPDLDVDPDGHVARTGRDVAMCVRPRHVQVWTPDHARAAVGSPAVVATLLNDHRAERLPEPHGDADAAEHVRREEVVTVPREPEALGPIELGAHQQTRRFAECLEHRFACAGD